MLRKKEFSTGQVAEFLNKGNGGQLSHRGLRTMIDNLPAHDFFGSVMSGSSEGAKILMECAETVQRKNLMSAFRKHSSGARGLNTTFCEALLRKFKFSYLLGEDVSGNLSKKEVDTINKIRKNISHEKMNLIHRLRENWVLEVFPERLLYSFNEQLNVACSGKKSLRIRGAQKEMEFFNEVFLRPKKTFYEAGLSDLTNLDMFKERINEIFQGDLLGSGLKISLANFSQAFYLFVVNYFSDNEKIEDYSVIETSTGEGTDNRKKISAKKNEISFFSENTNALTGFGINEGYMRYVCPIIKL